MCNLFNQTALPNLKSAQVSNSLLGLHGLRPTSSLSRGVRGIAEITFRMGGKFLVLESGVTKEYPFRAATAELRNAQKGDNIVPRESDSFVLRHFNGHGLERNQKSDAQIFVPAKKIQGMAFNPDGEQNSARLRQGEQALSFNPHPNLFRCGGFRQFWKAPVGMLI